MIFVCHKDENSCIDNEYVYHEDEDACIDVCHKMRILVVMVMVILMTTITMMLPLVKGKISFFVCSRRGQKSC